MLAPPSRSSRPVHVSRLHAATCHSGPTGPDGSRVQWYIAAPGMSFAAQSVRKRSEYGG